MDKSIMESLRDYIATFPLIDVNAPFTMDDISDKDKSYCIMTLPQSQPIPDVLGNLKITQNFEFGLREIIIDDKSRMKNIRFLEKFNDWIFSKNKKGIYPALPDGCKAIDISIADSGYLIEPDEQRQTGLYVSLLKFTYRKGRKHV